MKKHHLFVVMCCLITFNLSAQKLSWYSLWGNYTEGSHIRVNKMVIDSEDNIYTVADFCGDAVKIEDEVLVSQQGADLGDAVIVKTNPDKEVLWIRTFAESRQVSILDVAVDKKDNVVVAGTFNGIISIDDAHPMEMDPGEYDDCVLNIFVARLDKNGNLLNQWNIPVYELTSLRISTDADCNVYVGGTYGSSIQFSGTTVDGQFNVDNQLFWAKYSPAGELLMKKFTTSPSLTVINATITVDDTNGDIYIGGTFTGILNFAGESFTITSDVDMFLAKYDAAGTELWIKRVGGTGSNENGLEITLSPLGDVALSGNISSTELSISGVDSLFTYQYTSTSNTHSAITAFKKDGTFRWQYWYGYSVGDALLNSVYCSDEGVYYIGITASGRAGDISTGKSGIGGQNSGVWLVDGQHMSHNTNGGRDAIALVLSPEGKLCNYYRPGGQQSEEMKSIVLSKDKKQMYFLMGLFVRAAIAKIPLDNFWTSFTDINPAGKLSDFVSITVPCPETGTSYTSAYVEKFFSGVLLQLTFPEFTPDPLPVFVDGETYSQTFTLSNTVGTTSIFPLSVPDGFTFSNDNVFSGNPVGDNIYRLGLMASDLTPRESYYVYYEANQTWENNNPGSVSIRGNSRNVRNFTLKSTGSNAIKDVKAEGQVIAVRYYNLQGIEIAQPTYGTVCLVKKFFDSGKIVVEKQMILTNR